MIVKFGGHAMAAGLTIATADIPRFTAAFEAIGREWLTAEALSRVVETDGELEDAYFTPQFVELIDAAVWGQGFPAPVFSGEFDVASQALVKDKHLKLQLLRGRQRFNAIWFNHVDPLPRARDGRVPARQRYVEWRRAGANDRRAREAERRRAAGARPPRCGNPPIGYNFPFLRSRKIDHGSGTSQRDREPSRRPAPPRGRATGVSLTTTQKPQRLDEVNKVLEDPNVWNDSKNAQALGREKKLLDGVVTTLTDAR